VNSTESNIGTAPNPTATGCWIIGLMVALFSLTGKLPTEVCGHAAHIVGVTLLLAVGLEVSQNWRAILRPDVVALCALYFLTFFEFLLPQPAVDSMISRASISYGIVLCLIAFGGIALGRHLAPPVPRWMSSLVQYQTSPAILIAIFWLSFFLGHLYMLLAVNFNIGEMIDQMMGPRFTQPWQRDRFGDWKALLNEVGMMTNLIPPLGGLILSKRERYKPVSLLLVAIGVLFVIFEGLAGSTRNVLAVYLITFLVGYGINITRKRLIEFLIFCLLAVAGFYQASSIMLDTRTIGLKNYMKHQDTPAFAAEEPASFYVDLNLVNLSAMTEKIPATHPYLGLEVPFVALVHPIPRALWHGKPEGLSLSIEETLGEEDDSTTLSTTFIGEAYLAGGFLGVIIASLFFGMLTGWWGRLTLAVSSELGFLIYASGFFATAISMRSLFVLSTAVLPTIAALSLTALFCRLRKSGPGPADAVGVGPIREIT
jgi:hypothetical protein